MSYRHQLSILGAPLTTCTLINRGSYLQFELKIGTCGMLYSPMFPVAPHGPSLNGEADDDPPEYVALTTVTSPKDTRLAVCYIAWQALPLADHIDTVLSLQQQALAQEVLRSVPGPRNEIL